MKINGVKNTECKCKNPKWTSKEREDGKGFIYACSSCGHKWLRGTREEVKK